jgi:hypothetical protein
VANLYELDLLLPGAQRFEDAVDPVTREAEHHVNTPVNQAFREQVGYSLSHFRFVRPYKAYIRRLKTT